MAENNAAQANGEVEVLGSLGGTEDQKAQATAMSGTKLAKPMPAALIRDNESTFQGLVHQNVEAVGFDGQGAGIVQGADNNDEEEPGQATVNQKTQIQHRQQVIHRPPAVAASMQAQHMPAPIISDHVSVGGKSQLHQRTSNAQDLLGENVATRSHHTEEQAPLRVAKQVTNDPEFQIESQQLAVDQPENGPGQIYKQEPAQQQVPNYQTWKQDPKLLTKSTYDGQTQREGNKFLPAVADGKQQTAQVQQTQSQLMPNGGYISDFYKKKQYTSSDGSNKVGMQIGVMAQSAAVGPDYPGGAPHPNNKLNKISSKKFFKSKIDFAAPIKSLQHKGGNHDPNLSDDSYIVDANHNAYRQFTHGQNMPPQHQPMPMHSQMSGGLPPRAVAQTEISNRVVDKYVPGEQPLTQMEGYTNLSLIKEEDFQKHGVGHLHAKNASKRVYQNNRRQGSYQPGVKGRKASEATTVGNGSNPSTRKQYQSMENRYQTPLKLPNLRTPGSKKHSNAPSSTLQKPHPSNLSTVVESNYSKGNVNGKVCHICLKKLKVGQVHNHGGQHSNNISFGGHGSGSSGVKGAPYYQAMQIQKPSHPGKQLNTLNQRSNSNGRAKTYNRQLRAAQPKWLSKEYKPVFKMPGSGGGESQTIQHRTSDEFVQASNSQTLPDNRPAIVTLSQSQNGPKAFADQGSLSPRSDQPSNNTVPFTNSYKQKQSPELNKMLAEAQNTRSRMSGSGRISNQNQPHTVYQDKQQMSQTRSMQNHSQTRNQASPAMAKHMNSTGSTVYSITPQAAKQIQQYKQLPMAYRSINKFHQSFQSQGSRVVEQGRHPQDPELICTEKQLPENIEEEIKDGFFELKQKFKDVGPSSIYISHVTLHEKHPLLRKIEIETLKQLLLESSVIYLSVNQTLYRYGSQDNFVYIILFGKLLLQVPDRMRSQRQNGNDTEAEIMTNASQQTQHLIGRVNIGWTLGEEILFDRNLQIRQEMAVAESESCLIGINKAQLAIMQKNLLEQGNEKDYFVIESILKGNFLVKDQWRREYNEGLLHSKGARSETSQSNISQKNIQVVNPQGIGRGR